jgi:hypothetical protein
MTILAPPSRSPIATNYADTIGVFQFTAPPKPPIICSAAIGSDHHEWFERHSRPFLRPVKALHPFSFLVAANAACNLNLASLGGCQPVGATPALSEADGLINPAQAVKVRVNG